MSATALHGATATAVAAATTQPDQISALKTQFGTSDVTVRAMAGGTIAEVGTYGQWALDSLTPRGMTLGDLAASTVNVPDATITSFVFVAGSTPIFSIPASDVGLDSPTTKTGRRTSLADGVLTKHRIVSDANLPVGEDPPALTYLLTFAAADTATVDVAVSGSIVNTGTGACAWSITPPAHVSVTPSSGTIAAGGTQSLSVSIDTAGTYDLTLVSSGTTITGATQTVVASLASAPGTFPTVPTTGLATLTLTPATTGTHAWSLGHTLKQGDLPAGSALSGIQCTVKSTWPDGSAKIAVLAGGCAMTAATARTVGLQIGTAPGGAALSTADLASYLTDPVTVDAGAFGSASWSGADWASPFQTWVSGPLMSSWIYRKPVGSDAHLVAWLEVRLWTNGEVEILPWIENGYLTVAGPTNKSDTYTFTMGGTSRFSAAIDLKHHQRTVLVSGTALSHWLSTDAGVVAKHDAAYLMATELVPTYRGRPAAGSNQITGLPTTFVPLAPGNFVYGSDNMAGGGYQRPIGLLPMHDVLHLVADASDRAVTYAAVVRAGYSAGRYSIHYRDESTNRPAAFSAYPTLVLVGGASSTSTYTPATSGGSAPGWDVAHSPSVGFMAYLITGRFYFMEETQFAATANHWSKTDTPLMRNGASGLVQSNFGGWQTRAAAWQLRTLAQALAITPDADSLKAEFQASWHANIDQYHAQYVAQPNNPWGWVEPGEPYSGFSGAEVGPPWQQDFHTAACGYALAMDLTSDATRKAKWQAFFAWKAQSIVKRLGPSSGFWYINGAPYLQSISSTVSLSDSAYRTGIAAWRTEAESYAAMPATLTTAGSSTSWIGSTEGVLSSELWPENKAVGKDPSTWHNLQPAIAYAVRHGVSGALAAYNRMLAASNWSELNAGLTVEPLWSVSPASGATPAWLASAALHEWVQISGTSGANSAQVDAFSGFAVTTSGDIVIPAAGGHGDSDDNRVVSLSLMDDAPSWTTLMAASVSTQINVDHYADGKPSSRHTYTTPCYVPSMDRVFLVGCTYAYGAGNSYAAVDAFDLGSSAWDTAGTYTDVPGGDDTGRRGVVFDGTHIWINTLARYEPETDTWTTPISSRISPAPETPFAFDSSRSQLFGLQYAGGTYRASKTPIGGTTETAITLNSSAALTQYLADGPVDPSLEYDPNNDRFLLYDGRGSMVGRVFVITPNAGTAWDMSILTLTGTAPGATVSAGIQGRFRYVAALNGFVLLPYRTSNLYFFRVA